MNKIQIKILNKDSIDDSKKLMGCAARLTQRGHLINNLDDFIDIYNKPISDSLEDSLVSLPHTTLQKFGIINIIIIGASRRFLAQITRHQNEVKFMSGSLQYSDYSDDANFCIPYEIICANKQEDYLNICKGMMKNYKNVSNEYNNDAAGYLAPQGLRNILLISATPYQWIHMINQRVCRRNTSETRYVMLKIWEQLYKLDPIWFKYAGPDCTLQQCREQKMSCGNALSKNDTPTDILKQDFSYFYTKDNTYEN